MRSALLAGMGASRLQLGTELEPGAGVGGNTQRLYAKENNTTLVQPTLLQYVWYLRYPDVVCAREHRW